MPNARYLFTDAADEIVKAKARMNKRKQDILRQVGGEPRWIDCISALILTANEIIQ